MANDFYTDEQLEQLFGRRLEAIAIFEPMGLGWVCPFDPGHDITWSGFNMHIWCYECDKDYFTLLCPKQMKPFTATHILRRERELVLPEMKRWTIEWYRHLYCVIRKEG